MTDLDPLDPSPRLVGLLAADDAPPRARDARARVFSRLQVSIDSSPLSEGDSGVVARIRRPWLRWGGLRVAAAFALGSIAGAAAHEVWLSSAPRVVYVDRVVAAPPERFAAPSRSLPAPRPPEVADPEPEVADPQKPILDEAEGKPQLTKTRARGRSSPARKPASSLADELALIDGARAALSRLDSATALAALEEHRRRYPSAKLAQERDALFVRTFVALGRYDDAREHARRFELEFPNSSLQGSVEKALRTIP
jgi:hypothetical protein